MSLNLRANSNKLFHTFVNLVPQEIYVRKSYSSGSHFNKVDVYSLFLVLNKKIMDLDFPLTAIIGGIIRQNKGIIALGDFEIQLGDRVLVCSKPESIKKVESLFLYKLFEVLIG